jgi:hypothetical protein
MTPKWPGQGVVKKFQPADNTDQAAKPVITPTLETPGPLFAEEGTFFEAEPGIKPPDRKSNRSSTHMFSKSLLREAIEIMPRIPYTRIMEEVRIFLSNNLHYNSEKTRMRYANYVTRRLFPSGQVDMPIFHFQENTPVCKSCGMCAFTGFARQSH